MDWSRRESDVLLAFERFSSSLMPVSQIVRVINLETKCDWCRVGPPLQGEKYAYVPKTSYMAVQRVLDRLVKDGRVVADTVTSRKTLYRAAVASA